MSQTETALSGQKRHGLRAYKWKALATVAMGTIMATMDMSIVNLSFPTLTRVFGADLDTVCKRLDQLAHVRQEHLST